MSDWKEVVEEGRVFWINDELGNVVKVGDDSYVAMVPLICRLGPFNSLEDAKEALTHKQELKNIIEEYNHTRKIK
jgi:hypothetical protein